MQSNEYTTSKIVKIAPQGTQQWKGMTLLKDFLMFENGDSGVHTTFPERKQPEEGQELTYKIIDKGFGAQVEVEKPASSKPSYRKKDEAMINAIAITKSALESQQLKLEDYKTFFIETYGFFKTVTDNASTPNAEPPAPAARGEHVGQPHFDSQLPKHLQDKTDMPWD